MPAVGSLDDPAAGTTAHAANECRLAPSTNMRLDTSSSNCSFGILVVVSLVQTDVARAAWTSWRSNRNRVERFANHPLVMDVGPGQRDANRNATPIGQYVAFGAELAPIGGIRSGEGPPFGAFTEALSSEHQFQSMPRSSS